MSEKSAPILIAETATWIILVAVAVAMITGAYILLRILLCH